MKRLVAIMIGFTFAVAAVDACVVWAQIKKDAPAKTEAKPAAKAEAEKPAVKKGGKLDLNTASAEELKAAGFSATEAKKIAENRPYKRKDELVRKGIISQPTYDKFKEQIIAHQVKEAKEGEEKSNKGGKERGLDRADQSAGEPGKQGRDTARSKQGR